MCFRLTRFSLLITGICYYADEPSVPNRGAKQLQLVARKNYARLLFNHQGVLRKFLWAKQGSDGSVYLGFDHLGTLSRSGAKTREGSDRVTISYSNGQPAPPGHAHAKLSLHPSGQVHVKTSQTARGQAFLLFTSQSLRNLAGAVCGCSIVPRDPATLPLHSARPGPADGVIDTQLFRGARFGVHVYLTSRDFPRERFLRPPKRPLACALGLEACDVVFVFDQPPGSDTTPWPPFHYVVFPPSFRPIHSNEPL